MNKRGETGREFWRVVLLAGARCLTRTSPRHPVLADLAELLQRDHTPGNC